MKRVAVLAVAALAFAACGSDTSDTTPATADQPDATAGPGTDGSATAAPTTDAPTTDAPTTDAPSDTSSSADGSEDAVAATAFPVTIEHKFGSSTIAAEPQRVVSVGFNEHDFLLALGVVPVGLRDWYGDQPNGVWPWAQDELGGATPEVIPADGLNFEQIAALDPDLIVGVWSGMTEQDYDLLTAIAPTVAQPDAYEDYGTPWQEQTEILGRATGRSDEAAAVVARIEERTAEIRADHPGWAGLEATVAFVTDTGPGAYTSQDTRSRIMSDLGFSIPAVNDSGGDGSFFLELSAEDLSPLDVDVLVWIYASQEELDGVLTALPTRPRLDAVAEGREVFADIELTGAFSHGSPLSLEFALDQLVPELEAAVDGDPTTVVPSAAEVGAVDADAADGGGADLTESESADEAAAAAAAASASWATVFDSTTSFDDKSALLEGADGLAETVEAYEQAGAGFGGISLEPTSAVVDGDTAVVTYDVNFGENPAYSDQTGELMLVDGVWMVSRDQFCAFMSSARVSC